MSSYVVLFGPPGSGKGTQASKLAIGLGVPHMSTGEMFRDHKERGTELGAQVSAIMSVGGLVPDTITNEMVEGRLNHRDVENGVILDGYPRTAQQAEKLDELLRSKDRSVDCVLVIVVPPDECLRRLLRRGATSGRDDDQSEEKIRVRLDEYAAQSAPCIAYYQATGTKVYEIDGVGSVDEVARRLDEALGLD